MHRGALSFFGGVGITTFSVHWMSLVQLCSWSQRCVLSLPASSGTLRPSLQDLLTALDAGKLASEGKPVAEALASYKAKVRLRTAVGFFRFFALWVFWPWIPFTFASPYLPSYQVGRKDVDAWNQSVVRIKFLVWCLLGLFIHMYSVNYFLVGYLYIYMSCILIYQTISFLFFSD